MSYILISFNGFWLLLMKLGSFRCQKFGPKYGLKLISTSVGPLQIVLFGIWSLATVIWRQCMITWLHSFVPFPFISYLILKDVCIYMCCNQLMVVLILCSNDMVYFLSFPMAHLSSSQLSPCLEDPSLPVVPPLEKSVVKYPYPLGFSNENCEKGA